MQPAQTLVLHVMALVMSKQIADLQTLCIINGSQSSDLICKQQSTCVYLTRLSPEIPLNVTFKRGSERHVGSQSQSELLSSVLAVTSFVLDA